MTATNTGILIGSLGALGEFLNFPGAGALIGFGMAWYCFHSLCDNCKGKK